MLSAIPFLLLSPLGSLAAFTTMLVLECKRGEPSWGCRTRGEAMCQ